MDSDLIAFKKKGDDNTMKLFGKELTFNNNKIYHTGNKPTVSEIGALPTNGVAASATKLAIARQINGVNFDGTANITIPVASHNHDSSYLKLTGGTVTGSTTFPNTLVIKSNTKGATSAISLRDETDATVMYMGRSTGTNNVFRIVNSLSGGDISFGTNGGNIVYTDGHIKLGNATTSAYRSFEVNRLCSTNTDKAPRKVRYGLNDVEGGVAGIELQENDTLLCSLHFGSTFFRPNRNGTINLGTSSYQWKDGYFSNSVNARTFALTGTSGYVSYWWSKNVRMEYDVTNDALYVAGNKSTSSGLREFRATQCNSTVNAIIAGKRVFVQSGTPSGVSTGDVWVQV